MSNRDVRILLEDILEAIDKIISYTDGMTYEAFELDFKTVDAVVRNIEIIGEAAIQISKSFRDQFPLVKWKQIIGMRHRIIHEYFGVDTAIIWFVIQDDLSALRLQILEMIEQQQS